MILLGAHEIGHSFGSRTLFEKVTFSIETRDRIGLIGPNGAGKSTLLKILSGELTPGQGSVSTSRGLRIGFLQQVPYFKPKSTLHETVVEGLVDVHDWNE